MTMDLDASLGQLLTKVDELGLDDNTYVIYLSDNGGVPNIPGAKKYEKSLNEPLSRGKWDAMEGGTQGAVFGVGSWCSCERGDVSPCLGSGPLAHRG